MVNYSQVLINRYNQELSEIKPVEAEDDDQLAALQSKISGYKSSSEYLTNDIRRPVVKIIEEVTKEAEKRKKELDIIKEQIIDRIKATKDPETIAALIKDP